MQRIDHKMRWSCHGESDSVLLYLIEGVMMMREQQQAIGLKEGEDSVANAN